MARHYRPGDVVDGFTLEERMHQGGMANLWRVTHPQHTLPMLMKMPIVEWGEGPGAIVGFEVEQMILPRLSGPHVPRFVAAADFSEQAYIVMELIPGGSLLHLIEKAPLDPAHVAGIGAKVAAALHDLHRQHVIHFDIKPDNILMRESGEAVLVDFGLSRHDQLPDLLAEEFRLPVGTAPYISPEQVLGNRTDPRSDLFSLGAMLYLFATGERPFGNPQGSRALRRRLWRDPKPPRAIRRDVPPWLQEAILRCLEIDPERRHATAGQLAFDLSHPDQVVLTERAHRASRAPLGTAVKRWFATQLARPAEPRAVAGHLAAAPIVMAAVDLSPEMHELAEALRTIVRRILEIEPKARLACVNVLKVPRVGIDFGEDAEGRNLHVRRLVALKHWARPLGLAEGRVTYTVLQSPDPADALLDYAHQASVDHIVIGARASSAMRRYLGSVSSQVVAEAPCNVTVVRTRAADPLSEDEGAPLD
ncbi:MAG TPA: bifunctional serine/threonine-protein kinase/universal stress protein [Beijerinckiaceae bacterium]|jgi:nucleotide-binding universal stress UspA family protein